MLKRQSAASERWSGELTEILHIVTGDAWDRAVAAGEYRAASLATEGFIHCSTGAQLPGVVERYYAGQNGLLVLRIAAERVAAPLRWEAPASRPDEHFPHIYGVLNPDAVVDVVPLERILSNPSVAQPETSDARSRRYD